MTTNTATFWKTKYENAQQEIEGLLNKVADLEIRARIRTIEDNLSDYDAEVITELYEAAEDLPRDWEVHDLIENLFVKIMEYMDSDTFTDADIIALCSID